MKKFLLFLLCLSSCASVQKDYAYLGENSYQARPPLTESLIPAASDTMNEANFAKVLESKFVLPKNIVLAVVRLNESNSGFQSIDQELANKFYQSSKWGSRMKAVVPALLLPSPITLQGLRRSAATLQADMVLVLSSNMRVDWKYRFLKSDMAKAFTSLDMLLLDTRTGIVPFTLQASESVQLPEKEEDFNNFEWMERTKFEAEKKCLQKVALETSKFFNALP